MTTKKLSELPLAGTYNGSEYLLGMQNGMSTKFQMGVFADIASPQLTATNGLILNNSVINISYSFAAGCNGMSVGPLTVASGASVTVPSGQRWVIL